MSIITASPAALQRARRDPTVDGPLYEYIHSHQAEQDRIDGFEIAFLLRLWNTPRQLSDFATIRAALQWLRQNFGGS